ncbi:MAG: M15 family metallopeptidase [Spirochaetaceae bacterium]|jgi:D-alanyl-D-alanine carboxypeptidase|nr:M15 family metallopeptidase [Spirochaetaceae bacterium]
MEKVYSRFFFVILFAVMLCTGCQARNNSVVDTAPQSVPAVSAVDKRLLRTAGEVRFPGKERFLTPENAPLFLSDLAAVLAADTENLLILVDKKHYLSVSYEPDDLALLGQGSSYLTNKSGMLLRRPAEQALERLAADSRADGVAQVASSAYRSYEYQVGLYERNVRQLGKEAADRESAAPGTSQHQLGTVVDFGSITDEFAGTRAGLWLAENAWKYGFSLSFPDGYEEVTGYRWECWHFRYIGEKAALFQRKWFDDIQQYMIEFIDAWRRNGAV